MVCKQLLVDPALKRLAGVSIENCLPPRVRVRCADGSPLTLDPERPEFHRVHVSFDFERGDLVAVSTGEQRSSRLMSLASSNALMLLPAGTGPLPPQSIQSAYLTAPITNSPPIPLDSTDSALESM